MTFEFALLEPASKAWTKLDRTVRDRFEARLAERLENPRIPSTRPRGQLDRDEIGLRSVRYCLVYEVREAEVVVRVVVMWRRERDAVCLAAMKCRCDTRCGLGVSRLVSSNRPVPPVRPSLPARPASSRRRRG
ncbi:type II toxin-antitoxin system RelE/ParE family toxin [Burkholderia cepacia]|uniref:type II toxin-antitoxin system RelE family toxin n=1 Tax=Burkholderia cepacia TaxID=292 RepID=UPI001C934AAC|nr:type II toxin-antitoxin system RelE/ParE family toxin [Burkholderia cepacia]MBY4716175.1 type II toxin-antitoxin system RelE/ParE family toxin [Burkholderia cepacia]MBY4742243.1 type II toxin-antitoxin system RelE/ParE family toxin [Burkholderia cepacia]MBY4749857.1 type II toxin-antitoxin system RelE/ParE family toxin [Burkholderia cepacia]MBY4763338.1 type II toxin-antitoxin system RelE/ParE family toxin [Burkholderia cepacia]MBY4779658.1 type II toxin-antitoxin system RelE/ParE family to